MLGCLPIGSGLRRPATDATRDESLDLRLGVAELAQHRVGVLAERRRRPRVTRRRPGKADGLAILAGAPALGWSDSLDLLLVWTDGLFLDPGTVCTGAAGM